MNLEKSDEVYKQIVGSNYWVSNYGKVFHEEHKKWCPMNNSYSVFKRKNIILSNNNSKKYWRIRINYDNKTHITESVHRLVAQYFVPNPFNKEQVNHKDGNKDNNHYSNLEWVTNAENMLHKHTVLKKFTTHFGKKCTFNKLTEEQVIAIAERVKKGEKIVNIAKDYEVGASTISELKAGRSWRQLNLFPIKARKSEKYFDLRYDPSISES
jgi:hypothetical protein